MEYSKQPLTVNKQRKGRPAGAPNKVTTEAKEAITRFVDSNSAMFQEWLDSVAKGIKKPDSDEYIIRPDPALAFRMVTDVIEYCLPKLARTEQVGDKNQPIHHVVKWED